MSAPPSPRALEEMEPIGHAVADSVMCALWRRNQKLRPQLAELSRFLAATVRRNRDLEALLAELAALTDGYSLSSPYFNKLVERARALGEK